MGASRVLVPLLLLTSFVPPAAMLLFGRCRGERGGAGARTGAVFVVKAGPKSSCWGRLLFVSFYRVYRLYISIMYNPFVLSLFLFVLAHLVQRGVRNLEPLGVCLHSFHSLKRQFLCH